MKIKKLTRAGLSGLLIVAAVVAALNVAGAYLPKSSHVNAASQCETNVQAIAWGAGNNGGSYSAGSFCMVSPDGSHHAYFQSDSNFTLWHGSSLLWQSGTGDGMPYSNGVLRFQADGNVVTYTGGRALWNTGVNSKNRVSLKLQNDGNLVQYASDGRALWSTGTSGR